LHAHEKALKSIFTGSLYFALSQAAIFFVLAYAFKLSAVFLLEGIINFTDVFGVIFPALFSMFGVGQALSQLSVMSRAAIAAENYFKLVDRPTLVNSGKLKPVDVQGSAALKQVEFYYPQRPDATILKGISLDILKNQTIALVGSSGSGKSTVLQLLMRFYDTNGGDVIVESSNIKEWDTEYLRDQMALVSQDPILFRGTVEQNIAFGCTEIDSGLVEQVAKQANIHDFINGLPEKYQTEMTNTTASGGQKQRIVIARALYRKPKYLLLDEATSALDTESEKIVQQALQVASQGRTTVTIAHRLSTIQDANHIIVMAHGEIKETGTHDELYAMNGVYTRLVDQQKLNS